MPNNLPDDAAAWDARLRASDCSESERAAFKRWCEQSLQNHLQYEELQQMLRGLRDACDVPEVRSLREAALDAAPPMIAPRRRLGILAYSAAAAVGLLVVGLAYMTIIDLIGLETEDSSSFATAVGERSTMNLEDGTVTVLNTNTRLGVDYSDHERRVTLLQGQALFDVSKDTARPFVVAAGEQLITAVGTVFDVRYERDDVHVTLVEGVVDVRADAPIGTNLTGPVVTQPAVRLSAGQQLSTTAMASPTMPRVEDVNVDFATIWRQGRVFFADVPLSEAVAEMNRYSTTQIIVADPMLNSHRVNGMFRTGHQLNFVDTLESYFPLEAEQNAKNQITLRASRGH